jgi:hypothetical protein
MGICEANIKDNFDGRSVVVEGHGIGFETNLSPGGQSGSRITIIVNCECDNNMNVAAGDRMNVAAFAFSAVQSQSDGKKQRSIQLCTEMPTLCACAVSWNTGHSCDDAGSGFSQHF